MKSRPSRLALVLVLIAVAALSAFGRLAQHQRIRLPGHASWVSTDADTYYHFRRLDRLMRDGFPPAETDPYLNYPHGSPIPWPPYYAVVTWVAAAPFAPEGEEARRVWIEHCVASLPLIFGVLTSVLAALAGRALAGNVGALIAGGYHALSMASIANSKSGNGDHHAFIALLTAAALLLLSRTLARSPLTVRQGITRGAALGAIFGVALGAWVASLLYLVPIQLVLGWRAVVHSRRPEPGLPALGLSFHLVALLVLLPAVLASPWKDAHPWMVVNLTWFHAAWLLLGAVVFAPLFFLRAGGALRAYPAVAAGAMALLAVFLLTSHTPPALGVREGFAWMGREEDFMASVWESRGLVGKGAAFDPFEVLGWGLLALPFAWAAMAWQAFRRNRAELLPWTVFVPPLFVQAMRQVRFTDALSMPMAVVLAWGAVTALRSRAVRGFLGKGIPRATWAPWAAAALALILTQWTSAATSARLAVSGEGASPEHPSALAAREMAEWIRAHTAPGSWSVLARWNWGHTIEWAADRPTVATNFGTYVGEDSFRDPSRFFLAESITEAEAILEARRSRYVMLTSWLPGTVPHMIRVAAPERELRYLEPGTGEDRRLRFEWFRTIGARLMYDGTIITPEGPAGALGFLRLVYVSPRRDPRPGPRGEPSPAGWIWEHVPGATVTARGNPGETFRVTMHVRYPAGHYEMEWVDETRCGEDGIARLRVPYPTDERAGDATVARSGWELGGRRGSLEVPAELIATGQEILLPGTP